MKDIVCGMEISDDSAYRHEQDGHFVHLPLLVSTQTGKIIVIALGHMVDPFSLLPPRILWLAVLPCDGRPV